MIINNGNSDKGFKELSQIFCEYDEAAYEDFLGFIDCPLTRFIMGKDDITIMDNEIQFGIISAYRPVFELENICSKFNCDVHVVYAHERETLTDWEGGPSIGRFSACLKNGEITYEKKSPDSQNNKEIHEYFSMAWDGNMSPDPIDSFTFFDQNKIGSGFFIKESEDDEDGFPPDFKQWLGLEEIDAPYGFIGYAEMENDLEDEEDGIDYEDEDFTIIRGKLTTYKGSASEVIIPEGVTSIGYDAFGGCENLTVTFNGTKSKARKTVLM